jgi:hypothetical protein
MDGTDDLQRSDGDAAAGRSQGNDVTGPSNDNLDYVGQLTSRGDAMIQVISHLVC